jgi:hypothetical protein
MTFTEDGVVGEGVFVVPFMAPLIVASVGFFGVRRHYY